MEKSSFFNSVSGDRVYRAEEWAEYFASFIGNGVFPVPSTSLQVVAGSGMAVAVKTGKAWINGYFYYNTSDLPVTLATADGVLNRIDRIVVRWDLTERKISVAVKSSAPATSPVAPALQRDADAYELCLADVLVGAGVTAISQANITDRRLDGSLCGVVAGVVDQIDTDAFNAQLEAWFADYKKMSVDEFNDLVSYMESLELLGDQQYAALEAYMNDFKTDAENDFNAWFATLQNVLDEDTAGHLLNLIQNNTARIEMLEAVLFNDITTNPFLILFDDLDGVAATGVWNAALPTDRMLTRCACKGAELSCIIGNIFTELRPPCDMCGGEAVTIRGITPTGHEATITLTAAGFDFEGVRGRYRAFAEDQEGKVHLCRDKRGNAKSRPNSM